MTSSISIAIVRHMPATLSGDYSKYPQPIQNILPHIAGEILELRSIWAIYSRLFMERQEFTEMMGKHLGGLLGYFQMLLQDELFITIARLTDKDSRLQTNLSLWSLLPATSSASDPCFENKASLAVREICSAAEGIRKHRHKRIAHYDLKTSLTTQALPEVKLREIREILERMEAFLNLFLWEFEHTTMFFVTRDAGEITGLAEATVFKALTYDELASSGTIRESEWKARASSLRGRSELDPKPLVSDGGSHA